MSHVGALNTGCESQLLDRYTGTFSHPSKRLFDNVKLTRALNKILRLIAHEQIVNQS